MPYNFNNRLEYNVLDKKELIGLILQILWQYYRNWQNTLRCQFRKLFKKLKLKLFKKEDPFCFTAYLNI